MKRWFRPVAYTVILVLAALAAFADPNDDPADQFVRSGPATMDAAPSTPAAAPVPAVRVRSAVAFAPGLFAAAARPAPVAAPPPAAPVVAPVPELKILGWMLLDAVPQVFVELNGENYTLTPTQSAEETYRFDRIGDGLAEFTYLPTGETRQFAVSDPAVIQE